MCLIRSKKQLPNSTCRHFSALGLKLSSLGLMSFTRHGNPCPIYCQPTGRSMVWFGVLACNGHLLSHTICFSSGTRLYFYIAPIGLPAFIAWLLTWHPSPSRHVPYGTGPLVMARLLMHHYVFPSSPTRPNAWMTWMSCVNPLYSYSWGVNYGQVNC